MGRFLGVADGGEGVDETASDLNPRSHFVVFHACKYLTVVLGASRCRLLGCLVSLVNGFGTLGVSSGGCVGGSGRVRLPVGSWERVGGWFGVQGPL